MRGRDTENSKKNLFPTIKDSRLFVRTFVSELEKEVEYSYMKRKHYLLIDGLCVDNKKGIFSYAFDTTDQINIPSDSPIHIYMGEEHFLGKIVSCAEDVVIFESSINFGKEIKEVEIATDTKQLIIALIDKLKEMSFEKGTITERLVCDWENQINNDNIVKGQENAIKHAINEPITFIWGPPGTGKTHTLAKIALEFISKGKRVLMVSYSNVSVDGSIERVDRLSNKKYKDGEIIRYGYPRDKKLIDDARLNSYSYVLSKNPELFKEYKELNLQRRTVDKKSKDRKNIDERLEEIRKHFKNEEEKLVKRSCFVATTVTKAVVDKAIYSQKFDLVLFDEASMAYVPHVVYTSSLAKESFVCLGDYQQLPPIAIAKDTQLTNDIFQYVGIPEAVRCKKGHKWLVMLNEQRRMIPEIADFISTNMYYGELESAPSMNSEHKETVKISPFVDEPISCIDLSNMYSICSSTNDSSYVNVLSALVTVNLILRIRRDNPQIENHTIGVITPYNAQARLLRTIIHSLELNHVRSATVHQFQGSECDIIIFDSVDCYLRRFASNLLTSDRLVNVAISRARGKFIFVGNKLYLNEKINKNDHMMYNLLKILDNKKIRYFDRRVYNAITNRTGKLICGEESEYIEMYYEDLINTQKEVCIDIRGNFKTEEVKNKLFEILSELFYRGKNIIVRFEKEMYIPKEYRKFSISAKVTNTMTIIDGKIVWHGFPSYDAKFISNGEYLEHSLSPVFRVNDRNVSNSIFNFLSLKHAFVNELAENNEVIKRKCPLCGGKMQKLSKGEIICASKSCGYSERVISVEKKMFDENSKIYSINAGEKFKVCTEECMIHVETTELMQTPEFISIRNEKGKMKTIYRVVKLFEFVPKGFYSMKTELDKKEYKKLHHYFLEFDYLNRGLKYSFMFLEEVSRVKRNMVLRDEKVYLLEYKDLLD